MRVRGVLVVAVMAAVLAVGSPAGALSSAPVHDADFPDPFVLRDGSGTYWAYATGTAGTNLQVISSADAQQWSPPPGQPPQDPLPELPFWADAGLTWAPSVLPLDGRYLMYYTVRHRTLGRQCVSVAVGDAPGGRFIDSSSGPLVCQTDRYGSIDPSPFEAPDGQRYLLWKSDDNAGGRPTHLWAQQLSADGLGLTGPVARLLSATQSWQSGIIEGPSMLWARGAYYLFYGAGNWESSSAGIGYAVCTSPMGSCTNQSKNGPWLGARPGALGPSGPATFVDSADTTWFAYHAWPGNVGYNQDGYRALFTDPLSFGRNGRPVLG